MVRAGRRQISAWTAISPTGPALALGVSESTLIDMTGAYAGILNGGVSVTPYGLDRAAAAGRRTTPLIGAGGGIGERVISEQAARELTYMMTAGGRERHRHPRAAGRPRRRRARPAPRQAARDAWFVGFTADYVAGVWMGYDDNTPLTGVTGGGLPAEIWHEVMVRVHEGLPAEAAAHVHPRTAPDPRPRFRCRTGSARAAAAARQTRAACRRHTITEVLGAIFGGGN